MFQEMSGGGENNIWLLLLTGLLFHSVYLFSIFDIYFISPLVVNISPIRPDLKVLQPPADRLVLVVGDGLRADRLFEDHKRAPFLLDVVKNRGAFGVSHTRVPTESRPGHVAIIAGFYEDVSAVTKGWKMNPVEFDSVFNQSRHTWSFGSPDILPMFKHGADDPDKVETFMYDHEEEDFAKEDASLLDKWVFEEVQALFQRSEKNITLNAMLRQRHIVFFLHLLGLDTNGHAHRPHSREYLANIRFIDDGIRKIERIIEEFYGNDGKTAYIFTADHGMSNIGNHGDGNPDNTRTPLISWGAGLRRPIKTNPKAKGHDEFSTGWALNQFERVDVNQADIAPLMSSLIGVPIPVNSVGRLPLEYLNATEREKSEYSLLNSRQIYQQFLVKQESKKNTELWYTPFGPLNSNQDRLGEIKSAISTGKYQEAIRKSQTLIDLSIDGLRYYQTYDWLFLRTIITLGYIGWMMHCFVFLLFNYVLHPSLVKNVPTSVGSMSKSKFVGITIFALLSAVIFYQHSPFTYYLYVGLMTYFWVQVGENAAVIGIWLQTWSRKIHWRVPVTEFILYIIALEILVLSYFRREVLSVWLAGMGIVWPFLLPKHIRTKLGVLLYCWPLSCLATGVFMLLPVELHDSLELMWAGVVSVVFCGIVSWYNIKRDDKKQTSSGNRQHISHLIAFQTAASVAAMILVDSTVKSLASKNGLPQINQILAWGLLLVTLIVPLTQLQNAKHVTDRLVVLYLTFAPTMIILSISYEVLFYSSYFSTLYLWLNLERKIYSFDNLKSNGTDDEISESSAITTRSKRKQQVQEDSLSGETAYRRLTRRDARIGLLFLLFINVAFFGTGNIASVASFQLTSVYRLTTVFRPFLMAILLVLKMITPFLFLASTFTLLTTILALHPLAIYVVTLCVSDIMTLNFFYLVRDEGSWLEIGMGISHFVIVCLWEVISGLLIGTGWILIRGVQIMAQSVSGVIKKRK